MIIENPNVETLKSNGLLQDIERAARVCYASEPTGHTKEFVDRLIKRKHGRPLEFGTVKLGIPQTIEYSYDIAFFEKNPYSTVYVENGMAFITTNYRVIVENDKQNLIYVSDMFRRNTDAYPFDNRHTFMWTISRGIADEFRTHTRISSLMRSTRYCNYSKDKFGHQVTFIRPTWFAKHKWRRRVMKCSWWLAEKFYMLLIRMGATAQEARDVLPLGIKTEFIQCGFDTDWNQFFSERCDKAAHPDARYIADKAKQIF